MREGIRRGSHDISTEEEPVIEVLEEETKGMSEWCQKIRSAMSVRETPTSNIWYKWMNLLDDGSPTSPNLGNDHGFISEEY